MSDGLDSNLRHSGIMHFSTSTTSAPQMEPSDGGIFTMRSLRFMPNPQVALQTSHSPHSVTRQLLGATSHTTDQRHNHYYSDGLVYGQLILQTSATNPERLFMYPNVLFYVYHVCLFEMGPRIRPERKIVSNIYHSHLKNNQLNTLT